MLALSFNQRRQEALRHSEAAAHTSQGHVALLGEQATLLVAQSLLPIHQVGSERLVVCSGGTRIGVILSAFDRFGVARLGLGQLDLTLHADLNIIRLNARVVEVLQLIGSEAAALSLCGVVQIAHCLNSAVSQVAELVQFGAHGW
ncbi:MAG: hypothetical protein DDT39_01143 [Firmicutes bacterium]|nr:hypothetical protein [candidate division NPL-UPA2 bacterium]